MTEEWKDVPNYNGKYQVSNLGRVRSLYEWNGNRYKKQYRKRISILNPTDNGNGYLIVPLTKGTKRKNWYVHRLVATLFVPNPRNVNVVNHLDYNKRNNRADNLEWVTQKENVQYSVERMKGKNNGFLPSTGERFVIKRGNRYELCFKRKYIGTFATIEEAVAKREQLYRGVI